MNDSNREVVAHYEAGVKNALLVEYRCRAKGCLLLAVWQTPNGPEFFAPGHRLSGRYTLLRDVERAALTAFPGGEDEAGGWAGRLDDYPLMLWVPLMCDHVGETAWMSGIRADIAGRSPGKPRRILWPGDTGRHN